MTGGPNIRAIGPEDAQEAQIETASEGADDTLSLTDEYDDDWDDEGPKQLSFQWIAPTLAVLTLAGWTGFFGWAHQAEILAGGTPQQWTGWITSWAIPTLLIVSLWLLAMRNSTREASKFGATAHMLSEESALLEQRLTTVNRELSLAREFLGSQSLELESLGRVASERLSEHAGHLQTLIVDNGHQVDAIASVSATALDNMSKLRDDLPVVANSAKDVSNQIGTAGRTANDQIAELVAGFQRLNDFGKASETQVDSIQTKIEAALTTFENQTEEMEDLAETRFAALREKSDEFRTELDGREVEALAAMRRRAQALADEFAKSREGLDLEEEEALRSLRARLTAMREEANTVSNSVQESETNALESWQGRIVTLKQQLNEAIVEIQNIDEAALASANAKLEALRVEAEAVDAHIMQRDGKLVEQVEARLATLGENEEAAIQSLTARLETLDSEIAARREAQESQSELLAGRSEAIAARIDTLRKSLVAISDLGERTEESIVRSTEQLVSTFDNSREAIDATDAAVKDLTEASVRLLELIQASAQHSGVELPEALTTAENRLSEIRDQAEGLKGIIGQAGDKSQELSEYVLSAQSTSHASIEQVDALRDRIAGSNAATHEAITLLTNDLSKLNGESELLSSKAQDQLREAISALEEAARNAPSTIEAGLKESVEFVASKLAKDAGEILDRTLHSASQESISRLEESAARASGVSRDAAIQLRDQLSKVNELASNLETRVSRAREQAEEQVGNDFARRMALITESLNSNAIDISKAMSSDVTDTAWASYLRGDRGIFTRRAVSLLDNREARDIAEVYDDDPEFRENVSRYIHDFESMLRSMLSTRDGNALSVTLLSSDMGKLYVALAQAIERLRE
ncbi:ATPase [Pontixanthobacter aestiaquae]|uniref:ATPase n=1 Tax=Pontixanthobacter aestiaquae TaxID=1509367 RepID=A0A844Z780_9SPHN|nr:ATPase [Pontixanthobacter aestiaquae]MDN3645331.1 ATPase [Pontixanthobacter aestiaquae]MXO83668.1 ATPase [Pontixanthobacter aestiaquae]